MCNIFSGINFFTAQFEGAFQNALPDGEGGVYGEGSYAVNNPEIFAEYADTGSYLVTNPVFSACVLSCFLGYCLIIYHFRPQAGALLNIFRSKLYIDKLLDEQNFIFETFINLSVALGLLMISVSAVKISDITFGDDILTTIPVWGAASSALMLWLILGIIWFIQNLTLRISGNLTRCLMFTADLIYLRRLVLALVTIICGPLMMMMPLSPQGASAVIGTALLIGLGALFIFLLMRTYMLFIEQKISILYWFLYLCAVEIFPLSFLILAALRGLD